MKKATWVAGLVLLALGGYVIVSALNFPPSMDGSPGPGIFPIIVACALILLVLLMLWENRSSTDNKPIVDLKSPDFHRVLYVAGAILLYVLVLPKIGFLIATPIGLFLTTLLLGRDKLLIKAITAGVTTFLLYGSFHLLLQVPLP